MMSNLESNNKFSPFMMDFLYQICMCLCEISFLFVSILGLSSNLGGGQYLDLVWTRCDAQP